jgi:hypothetical protein
MRLNRLHADGVEPPQAGHPIGPRPALDLVQPLELGGIPSHDQLPALLVGQAVLGAVFLEQLDAPAAQGRLQGAGRVVDPGMRNPAVVRGLVGADPVLLVEDRDLRSLRQLAGDREPQDAAADNPDPNR